MGQSCLESEICRTGEITEELWEKKMAKCRFLTGVRAMTLMSEHALKHALANFSMWGTCMLADLYILKTFFYTTNADLRSCNDHWFIKPKLLISIFDENAFFTWS